MEDVFLQAFQDELSKLSAANPGVLSRMGGAARTALKYAKWGGLGLGAYLLWSALKGAGRAHSELKGTEGYY